MTEDEIVDLLTYAAASDRRTVGRSDVVAWSDAATDHDWTFNTARRAIRTYYGTATGQPIWPGHVTEIISGVRTRIRRALDPDLYRAPADLADNPRAEREWIKARIAAHVSTALEAWANTGQVADTPERAELVARQVTERLALTAGADDVAA